ncbi:MAG TPA: hypothetical protein VGG38_13780 [Acidimicrobiales bacterium]
MSEYNKDAALSLEDVFLSREFGRPRNGSTAAAPEQSLFGSASPRGPLVPLAGTAAYGGLLVGHDTTTHLRRNWAVAAVGGVAAALLVTVGVLANSHNPGRVHFATGTTTPPTSGGAKHHKGSGTSTTTPTTVISPSNTGGGNVATSGTTAGATINLTGFTSPGTKSPKSVGTKPVLTKPVLPVTTITGTSPTPTPSSTAPGGVLAPVTSLLGRTVSTLGNTVSTAGTGLGATLPGLSPVTGTVGSLGGLLTGLGNSLSGTVVPV